MLISCYPGNFQVYFILDVPEGLGQYATGAANSSAAQICDVVQSCSISVYDRLELFLPNLVVYFSEMWIAI